LPISWIKQIRRILMGLEQEEQIIITDEEGVEHLFQALTVFTLENEQSYVATIPSEQKESEEVEVYVFRYEDDNEIDLKLFKVEKEEEWDIIEEILYAIENE